MITSQPCIQLATLHDVPRLVSIKQAVWPTESAEAGLITSALQTPTHQSYLALVDDQVAGFVSCFVTESFSGEVRWEIDLLAVHPNFRRRGVASHLVERTVEAGKRVGASWARALIAIDNIGSQRSFARSGFETDGKVNTLYVSDARPVQDVARPPKAHFVFVDTFNYRGIWVEEDQSEDALQAALALRTARGLDVVGILASKNEGPRHTIQNNHFEAVGDNQWWRLNLQDQENANDTQ